MDVLTLLAIGTMNIICFVIGAKVGQKVVKGETIELPKPIEAIREQKAKREDERKRKRDEVILHNIDIYDGTSNGQREVPKG